MSGLKAPPFDGLASGPDPWDVVVKVSPLLCYGAVVYFACDGGMCEGEEPRLVGFDWRVRGFVVACSAAVWGLVTDQRNFTS